MSCIHYGVNPIRHITTSKKTPLHPIVGFTHVQLNNHKTIFFPFIRVCIVWRVSYTTNTLSIINLPGTKALWISEIIWGNIFFNLFPRILEINLLMTLQRLISQKYVIHLGSFTFGISAIFVTFKKEGIWLEFRVPIIAWQISSPTVFQFILEKARWEIVRTRCF